MHGATEKTRKPVSARGRRGTVAGAGRLNKEIARALGIEVVTVKRHVGNIMRKLGARNRTRAAMCLAEAGSSSWKDVSGQVIARMPSNSTRVARQSSSL